ncbi:MAG: ABC transporter permease [Syntrophomonadaceae bacterium]|nr:ABC transporter permease [Syntrophomonadaceae bacterium]
MRQVWASLGLEVTLCARFLREGGAQTLLIALGIAVGVMVLVFLTTLIDGLQADLIASTVGKSPHLSITRTQEGREGALVTARGVPVLGSSSSAPREEVISGWGDLTRSLAEDPQVAAVVPVALGSGFAVRGEARQPVALRGMDLAQADRIYHLSTSLVRGEAAQRAGQVLLGARLAADLGVETGDSISLVTAGGETQRVLVGGIFELGVASVDQSWVVMARDAASVLLGMSNAVNLIEVQVRDVFAARDLGRAWAARLPGYEVLSWQESNQELLSGLRAQSSSSIVIQFFVLLAVVLGVSSVLAISALQKARQIGILKAMGIRTASVARVFLLQGAVLGAGGALLGCALGALLLRGYVYATAKAGGPVFPVQLTASSLLAIFAVTVVAATVAAYVPARRSAGVNPIEVIRGG